MVKNSFLPRKEWDHSTTTELLLKSKGSVKMQKARSEYAEKTTLATKDQSPKELTTSLLLITAGMGVRLPSTQVTR